MNLDAFITTTEAALLARVKPATIRSWALRYPDALPRYRARGVVLFRAGDVLEVERKTRTSR